MVNSEDIFLCSFTNKQKQEQYLSLKVTNGLTSDGFKTISIYLKNGTILTLRVKDILDFFKKSDIKLNY